MGKSRKGAPPADPMRVDDDEMLVFQIAPDIMAQPPAAWLCEAEPEPPEALPWDYVIAREMAALAEGELAAVRKALRRLLTYGLPRARMIYQQDSPREGAQAALEAVLEFLALFRMLDACQTEVPLRALLRSLYSLDLGAVEPMLQPTRTVGRPRSLQSMVVRGHAAAGVELARRSGRNLPAACKFVADRLAAAGYRVAAGHTHGAITAATVRAWRREALEREAADPLREIYDGLLATRHTFSFDWGIEAFFEQLVAQVPPAAVKKTPGLGTPEK